MDGLASGRADGRSNWRTDGLADGSAGGRIGEQMDGLEDVRTEGRRDGLADGRKERRRDGLADEWADKRAGNWTDSVASNVTHVCERARRIIHLHTDGTKRARLPQSFGWFSRRARLNLLERFRGVRRHLLERSTILKNVCLIGRQVSHATIPDQIACVWDTRERWLYVGGRAGWRADALVGLGDLTQTADTCRSDMHKSV